MKFIKYNHFLVIVKSNKNKEISEYICKSYKSLLEIMDELPKNFEVIQIR